VVSLTCHRVRPCNVLVIGLIGLVVALLSALAAPATATTSPEERRLAANRAKVAQIRTELEQARSRRNAKVSALQDAERKLATVMEAVLSAELAVQRQQDAVEQAQAELAELQARADQQRKVMAARAQLVYKQGTNGAILVLLDSTNPQDALRRSVLADVIDRSDQRVIERMVIAQKAVDAQRQKFQAQEAVLQHVLGEQRALLAEVHKVRSDRAMAVAVSKEAVAQLEAQEAHLEAEQREIAAIARRSIPPVPSIPKPGLPVPRAGGWVWPAHGRVTSGFGPRWGRMHSGIDIGASTGAPIVASRSGTVLYARAMRGYGNVVIIGHGGGLTTVYAHQSAILARFGQRVAQGQQIGRVGCSGSCTGPHLHFEVRLNGIPRNPRRYL
jgi:murein DD-endopeptidase MepM/ murein hydrolase activator NlpD